MQPETMTQPVALPRLTPEETLYRLFEEHVNPETYDGQCNCLMHQIGEALAGYRGEWEDVVGRLGIHDWWIAYNIYNLAGQPEYRRDYRAAMAMARRELGLDDAR